MVYMPGGSGPTRPSFCSQWQDRSSAWVTSGGSRTSATRTEEVKHVTAEVIVFLSLSFTALVLFGLSCFSFVGVWLWAPFWCALCVECKVSYPGVWKLVLSVDCVGSVASFKCNMFNPQGSVWGCNIDQSHCQCQKCAVILFLIIFLFEQKKQENDQERKLVAVFLAYSYGNSAIFARKMAELLLNCIVYDSRTLFLHMCWALGSWNAYTAVSVFFNWVLSK